MVFEMIEVALRTFGSDWRGLSELREFANNAELHTNKKQYSDAERILIELATRFHNAGYPKLVRAVISDLRSLLGSNLSREGEAWALNYEALAQAPLGEHYDEIAALESMLSIGRELADDVIISTALQNLAAVALKNEDVERAATLSGEALRRKIDIGDYFSAAQIILNMAMTLVSAGGASAALQLLSEFTAMYEEIDDPGLLCTFHGISGQVAVEEGRLEDAAKEFRLTLRLARRAGDLRKELTALQNLAKFEADHDNPGKAIRWYRKAIRLAQTADIPPQVEMLHRGLALALYRSKRKREALESLENAREVALRLDDRKLLGGAMADSGAILIELDRASDALQYFNEAINSFRTIEDNPSLVQALVGLSVALEDTGNTDEAEDTLTEAVDLAFDADRRGLLRILAELLLLNHKPVRAAEVFHREMHESASSTLREQAERAAEAGSLLAQAGGHASAIQFYERALDLYGRLRDPNRVFAVRSDRAISLTELKQYEEAISELKRARTSARRAKNRVMVLQATINLAEVSRRAGKQDNAARELQTALGDALSLGDRRSEAQILLLRGLTYMDLNMPGPAENDYQRALELGKQLADDDLQASAIGGLAGIDFTAGRFRKAASRYKEAVERTKEITPQRVEDAAGYLVSISAAGIEKPIGQAIQRLVDLAQEVGIEKDAALSSCYAAYFWLEKRNTEMAAELYTVAILLSLLGAVLRDPDDTDVFASVMIPIGLMVTATRSDPETHMDVVEKIHGVMRSEYGDLYEATHDLIDEAIKIAIETAN